MENKVSYLKLKLVVAFWIDFTGHMFSHYHSQPADLGEGRG